MARIAIALFLFLATTAYADPYDTAMSKAQEAFLIQSGINDYVNKIKDYGEMRVKRAVYSLIDPVIANTTATLAYGIYKRQIETKSFRNPYLHDLRHTLKIVYFPDNMLFTITTEWRF